MQKKASPALLKDYRISGNQVELKTLTDRDASDAYASWLNDPAVNKYLETKHVTIEELKDFIRQKNASDQAILLGIFCRKSSQHIGNVKLEPIDWVKKTAMIGLLIGDQHYWGKGIGTDVINLVTDFAWTELGLKEIRLGVISENRPAIRVYEKCGFCLDRVNKHAINHHGVLYDQWIMVKSSPSDI